jgi:hypothetical protein
LLVSYPDIGIGFQQPHTEVNQVELKEACVTYASITVMFNLKKKRFLNKKRKKISFKPQSIVILTLIHPVMIGFSA